MKTLRGAFFRVAELELDCFRFQTEIHREKIVSGNEIL